jgi:hypothetical protein
MSDSIPSATLVEVHILAYYLLNPAMLDVRDSALEAPAIHMAIKFAFYLIVPAAISLLYALLMASRTAKTYAVVLLCAFCIFLYAGYLGGRFGLNSWERLFLEGIPLPVFVLLTVVLMVRRLFSAQSAPNRAFQNGGTAERRAAERGRPAASPGDM